MSFDTGLYMWFIFSGFFHIQFSNFGPFDIQNKTQEENFHSLIKNYSFNDFNGVVS